MERRGSGLKQIKESIDDENRVEFFSNQSNFFVAMKKQSGDENADFIDERLMSDSKQHEKLIMGYHMKNKRIISKDAVVLTGISAVQVRRIFTVLQGKGIIEGCGNNRGLFYQLSKIKNYAGKAASAQSPKLE